MPILFLRFPFYSTPLGGRREVVKSLSKLVFILFYCYCFLFLYINLVLMFLIFVVLTKQTKLHQINWSWGFFHLFILQCMLFNAFFWRLCSYLYLSGYLSRKALFKSCFIIYINVFINVFLLFFVIWCKYWTIIIKIIFLEVLLKWSFGWFARVFESSQ